MNELRTGIANRIRRHILTLWQSRGGGFYGFVAVLTFLYIEAFDLGGDLAGLPGSHIDLGFIISFIVGNLVDAFVNGLMAAIWPVSWIGRFGVGLLSAGLLAGCYVSYRAVRPTVIRWLTPTDTPDAVLLGPDSPRSRA